MTHRNSYGNCRLVPINRTTFFQILSSQIFSVIGLNQSLILIKWLSGRAFACHAGGRGSNRGMVQYFFFFILSFFFLLLTFHLTELFFSPIQ